MNNQYRLTMTLTVDGVASAYRCASMYSLNGDVVAELLDSMKLEIERYKKQNEATTPLSD